MPDPNQPTLTDSPNAAATQPASQPAASAGGTTSPSAGGATAVDRLADLLDEADRTTAAAPTPTQPNTTNQTPAAPTVDAAQINDAVRLIQQEREERLNARNEADISAMVTKWQGDDPVLKGIDPDNIRAILNDEARKDPRLVTAFGMRLTKPQTWAQVEQALRQKVADRFAKQPNAQITADRAAVHGARAGYSETPPPAQGATSERDINAKSDREFAAYKKALFAGA